MRDERKILWLRTFFITLWATWRKNRTAILRAVPWSFLFSRIVTGITQILFPLFLYHYYFRGHLADSFRQYAGTGDYMTYVVLGAALNTLAAATLMNVGRALITELREGTLEPLLLSTMSRTGYFCGCLVEQTARALLEFAAVVLVGALAGADLGRLFLLDTVIVIFLAIFSFFCMGLTLSFVMLAVRDTYLTQNTLFNAMSLVCGVMFPISYLPEWVQRMAAFIPLTPAVTLFRRVVIGGQTLAVNWTLCVQILALSGIYLIIGIISYRKRERRLLESVYG